MTLQLAEQEKRPQSKINRPQNLWSGKRKVSQLPGLEKETSQLADQEKETLQSLMNKKRNLTGWSADLIAWWAAK